MSRRQKYQTREPVVTNRDPTCEPVGAATETAAPPRRYIAPGCPVVCPVCGHGTRAAGGRHVDPVARRVLDYRVCGHCEMRLAVGRDMTPAEARDLCGHADAVADYQGGKAGRVP